MVIILLIVIAFLRIYVLLVCNVKVGQARARAAQGIGVRFSQEWQKFKG